MTLSTECYPNLTPRFTALCCHLNQRRRCREVSQRLRQNPLISGQAEELSAVYWHQININYTRDRSATLSAPLHSYVSSLWDGWRRLGRVGLGWWCGRVVRRLSQWRTCRLNSRWRWWRLRRLCADRVIITVGDARVAVAGSTRFLIITETLHCLVQKQVVFLPTASGTHVISHVCHQCQYNIKGKFFPSVGPGADAGVQAVRPQVTWSESHHRPGGRLPLLSARPAVTSIAFTRWRHTIAHIRFQLTTHLLTMKGWKTELAWLADL